MALVYTETTAVTMFRDTVGDPAANPAQRWSNTVAVAYLNRGAAQLVLDIPTSLLTQYEITTEIGVREYAMPADFIADTRVEYVRDGTNNDDDLVLAYLDETQWKEAGFPHDKSNTGDPMYYTYRRKLGTEDPTTAQNKHLVLEPAPDAARTLRVHGFKLMQTIVDTGTDALELATPMMEAVVAWAAKLAFQADNDMRWRDQRAEYEAQVRKILSFMTMDTYSRPARLKPWNVDSDPSPMLPYNRRIV